MYHVGTLRLFGRLFMVINHLVKKVLLKDTSSSYIVALCKNEQLTTFLTSSSIMSLILRLYLVSCSMLKPPSTDLSKTLATCIPLECPSMRLP